MSRGSTEYRLASHIETEGSELVGRGTATVVVDEFPT